MRESAGLRKKYEFGAIIQSPMGSGKKELAIKYGRVIDGDVLIADHLGHSLRMSLMVAISTPSIKSSVRDLINLEVHHHKIVLISFKHECFGLFCDARYTYNACEYLERLRNIHRMGDYHRDELLDSVLHFPPQHTTFMEIDESLNDYIGDEINV